MLSDVAKPSLLTLQHHITAPCGSLLLLAVQSARMCERKAETLLLGNTRYPSGCSTWSSIHFCWSNSTELNSSNLSVCVRLQKGSKAANRHLPLSEIDEPLGLARGAQVLPVPVEKKLPFLLFSESARQLSSSAVGSPVSLCAGSTVLL